MGLSGERFTGLLYRALNPVYARTPLSGEGAARYGGRFNPVGMATLYTALTPTTALREANQVGDLQPTTLVSYRADLSGVFDTRDARVLDRYGMSPALLGDPGWREAMLAGRAVPTHQFTQRLVEDGYAALLVRSFARGLGTDDLNLVLWRWSGAGTELEVIDDDNRLDRL